MDYIPTQTNIYRQLNQLIFLLLLQEQYINVMKLSDHEDISWFSPISSGHAGEPGPGDITMLSNAFSLYK